MQKHFLDNHRCLIYFLETVWLQTLVAFKASNVNWTYIRRSEVVLDVFWKSFVRSLLGEMILSEAILLALKVLLKCFWVLVKKIVKRLYCLYRCFISDHFQIVHLVLAVCISILHVNLQIGKFFFIDIGPKLPPSFNTKNFTKYVF